MKTYAILLNVQSNKTNHNEVVEKEAPLLCYVFGYNKFDSMKLVYDTVVESMPTASFTIEHVKRLTGKDLKGRCFVQRQLGA